MLPSTLVRYQYSLAAALTTFLCGFITGANAQTSAYDPFEEDAQNMRLVSPVAHAASDERELLVLAERSSSVTHNHPNAIAGAQAVALTMWMARTGADAMTIRREVANRFEYDLSQTVDEIRPNYRFDVSCAGTVPQAITCALEGTDYEDAVRNAISIGGDSDTIACITGGIAEVMFGVPKEIGGRSRGYLSDDLVDVLERFGEWLG